MGRSTEELPSLGFAVCELFEPSYCIPPRTLD